VGAAAPDGTGCDDGDGCTRTDECIAGVCTAGDPVVCVAADQCHVAGSCDPASGTCSNPDAPEGTSCDDGNLCTAVDACGAGVCGPSMTFAEAPGSPVPLDGFASIAAVSDFDVDGHPDLVMSYDSVFGDGRLSIWLGAGSGAFVEAPGSPVATTIRSGDLATSVVASDVNHDGKPDLVVTVYNNGNYRTAIRTLLGTGSGAFVEAAASPMELGRQPLQSLDNLFATDFNLDGNLDLATTFGQHQPPRQMRILLGNGLGGFTDGVGSPMSLGGQFDRLVVAADINLDGKPDLAMFEERNGSAYLRTLLGTGSGTFTDAPGPPVSVRATFVSAVSSDFDRDGKPDLAATTDAGLLILLGDGTGSFTEAAGPTVSVGSMPVVADFNLDGTPDVAARSYGVDIALGNGSGSLVRAPGAPILMADPVRTFAVADFDGDGKPDLVTTSYHGSGYPYTHSMAVLLGTTSLTVCPSGDACHRDMCDPATGACTSEPAPAPDGQTCSDGVACTTNDACRGGACSGIPIVCTPLDACHTAGSCDPAAGICTNPYAAEGTACDDGNACTQTDACLDGSCEGNSLPDGTACNDEDLCTLSDTCRAGDCFPGEAVTCTTPDACHTGAGLCDPSTGICSYAAGPDAVVCDDGNECTAGETCRSGACAPDGSFRTAAGSPFRGGPTWNVPPTDFNLDGKLDLVSDSSVLLGDGAGGFTAAPGRSLLTGDFSRAVADFNGDGKPDLALLNVNEVVTILLGNGSGGFTRGASFPSGISFPWYWPYSDSIAAADFNLDGRPDLVVTNGSDDSVRIFLQDGSGAFAEAAGSPVSSRFGPSFVGASDFNFDGKPDLMVANVSSYYGNANLTIQLGDGTGRFSPSAVVPIPAPRWGGRPPGNSAIADLNLDGNPDVVVDSGDQILTVFLGDGSGGLTAAPASLVDYQALWSSSVVVADFNLDGKPDLAMDQTLYQRGVENGFVKIYLGDGTGAFTKAAGWAGGVDFYGGSLAAGDFDLDGKPDLAVGHGYAGYRGAHGTTILLGNPGLAPAGTSCSDGDTCTANDGCSLGLCLAGPPVTCDDGDPCTADSCQGEAGCVNQPADGDEDGVCDATDPCPGTILTPTVVIGACDSGVGNHLSQDGCNFGDRIAECSAGARNHGQFVSCVAHAVDAWKNAGVITGREGSRITRCAAQ
jgi:hypothetical protein